MGLTARGNKLADDIEVWIWERNTGVFASPLIVYQSSTIFVPLLRTTVSNKFKLIYSSIHTAHSTLQLVKNPKKHVQNLKSDQTCFGHSARAGWPGVRYCVTLVIKLFSNLK